MNRLRITYGCLIVIIIIAGLLSRDFSFIPLFLGDILWALMIYFIVRFLFVDNSVKFIVIVSLLFCYVIEFSQLYKAPWINDLRHTLFGRLVLGEGFLWSDLLCYTAGVALGMLIERYVNKDKANKIAG
jgi:hypothetical protein